MTLYFQEQFLKLKCTENTKSTIKTALKSERKRKSINTGKKYQGPEKKMQGVKKRYYTRYRVKKTVSKRGIPGKS